MFPAEFHLAKEAFGVEFRAGVAGRGRRIEEETAEIAAGAVVALVEEVHGVFPSVVGVGVEELEEEFGAAEAFDPGGLKVAADLGDELGLGEEEGEQGFDGFIDLERFERRLGIGFGGGILGGGGLIAAGNLEAALLALGFFNFVFQDLTTDLETAGDLEEEAFALDGVGDLGNDPGHFLRDGAAAAGSGGILLGAGDLEEMAGVILGLAEEGFKDGHGLFAKEAVGVLADRRRSR
jgi:hypothetical protein